jgi:hypothetical protein
MIKSKAKDKRHPKIINEWMVYEGINEINDVFGVLVAFKAYIKSDDYNKYQAEKIISSIQSLLCHGTATIEEWMEIEEVNKNV